MVENPFILVVEDSELDRKTIIRTLLKINPGQSNILSAASLAEATAEISVNKSIEIVILDIGLPDSSGLATVTAIHELAPSLPIIVLSGHNDEDIAMQSIEFALNNA